MTSAPAPLEADLLFAGDVFCDLVFAGVSLPEPGGEVFADHFGISPGGVATRAVAAARAGARTLLVGRVGDDPLGAYLTTALGAEPDLDTSLVTLTPGRQTAVSAALAGLRTGTGTHDRSFISYQEPLGDLVVPSDLGAVGGVHVSVADELPNWVSRLRAAGTTVVGGVGWDESGAWSPSVLDRLAELDVFVPNAVEAMRYTRTESAAAAAAVLAERVPLVVVTCGDEGVLAVDAAAGRTVHVPAVPTTAVDPTGAGDVFVATFMAGERHHWDLDTRLRCAALSAAVSVSALGGAASAPRLLDLSDFVTQHDLPGDWSFLPTPPLAPSERTEPR